MTNYKLMQLLLLLEEFKKYHIYKNINNNKKRLLGFIWDGAFIKFIDVINKLIEEVELAIDELKIKRQLESDLAGDASGRSKRSGV